MAKAYNLAEGPGAYFIVVYHALATLTGGAGCLPASQPAADDDEK